MRTRTISVHALGCRANQEEMECLLSRVADAGFRVVPFGQQADWTLVNTCTVTVAADSDSRQIVRQAARVKGRGCLVVTGCLAQRDPQGVAGLGGVDWVVGNGEKPFLSRWILGEQSRPPGTNAASAERVGVHPQGVERGEDGARIFVGADPTLPQFADYGASRDGRRARATLKIQDGCDHGCTFCVIPGVRGRSRSRPLEAVVRQAGVLAASGYREIVLTGINTALWGRDLAGKPDLPRLLEALGLVPGLERIRLNSLEPEYVTGEWLVRFQDNPRLCRHFHLPLQSGDGEILRRMNRRYAPRDYARLVEGIQQRMPDAAVGCDVMVGFPGETEDHFAATRHLVEALPLAYLHVFSYSARPGTGAARLPAAVDVEERQARSASLRLLDRQIRRRFAADQVGSVQEVLVEAPSGEDHWQGLTGNYLRVRFPGKGPTDLSRSLRPVRLVELTAGGLIRGRLVAS